MAPPTRSAYPIRTPIPLSMLPQEIKDAFSREFEMVHPGAFLDGTMSNDVDQVPGVGKPLMERIGGKWRAKWSLELLEALMRCPVESLSPAVYPGSALQLQEALQKFSPVQSKRVAVLGSVSPWVESLVLRQGGVQQVDTIDYDPIEIDPRISSRFNMSFVPASSGVQQEVFYDLVISFSSIEHDGLGRYGDPIDAEGDVCAVQEAYAMLQPGGFFVCGVPIGERSVVEGNYHRIYSEAGLERLFRGFLRVGDVPYPYGSNACSFRGTDWKNQPVFVLQKPK